MATIYDVARRAGVSISTVSRFLNNKERVKPVTCRRIEEAIGELQFVPNELARSLVTSRSHLIAAVVPDIANPYFSEMLRGIQDACAEADYTLTVCSTDGDVVREQEQLSGLCSKRIDGIFFVRHGLDDINLSRLQNASIPVAVFGLLSDELGFDCIGTSGTGRAISCVIQHVVKHGRQQLAHIAGPEDTVVGRIRHRQFKEAVKAADVAMKSTSVAEGSFDIRSGRQAMSRLLDQGNPNAVFAANDLMAIGALAALEERGLKAPEDVAIFGVDNIEVAPYLRPALTSISVPKYEIGRMGAEMLVARIEHPERPRVHTSLEAKAVFRTSTAVEARRL